MQATTKAAFAAGAKLITHFSNGMPKPSAGATTIAEASLAEKRIPLEMIIDGVHVSDEILKEVLASGDQAHYFDYRFDVGGRWC